jgi:hypothetical protein
MELSGDLSDFALTDILQILSLSRKTGTLLLEAGEHRGRLIIEQGCITHASLVPGETLVDRLVKERKIDESVWRELKRIGDYDDGVWSLATLLIESGVMRKKDFDLLARHYIEDVVASLVGIGKGRFWIELNQIGLISSSSEVRLEEGLEVGEVLLEVARESDESCFAAGEAREALLRASDNDSVDNLITTEDEIWRIESKKSETEEYKGDSIFGDIQELGEDVRSRKITTNGGRRGKEIRRGSNLCSLLMELGSHSFEAEVSLLVMRFASEVASRGMLFVVKGGEVCGLGQFGIQLKGTKTNPDQLVRGIKIGLNQGSIFDTVIGSGYPYLGELPEDPWIVDILAGVGGVSSDILMFLLPVKCQGKTLFLIYGDNYPENVEMEGLNELVALTNQASVVLEKIILERMVGGMLGGREWK